MERLDRAMLELAARDFDADVSRTPDIDHFCSSSAWVLPAERALMPSRELYCHRGAHGWALLARRRHEQGWPCMTALESAWCLASPFALAEGGHARGLAAELAEELARSAPVDVLLLSGLVESSAMFDAVVDVLAARYELMPDLLPPTSRFRASLAGGTRGFLARRSPGFRARLRQAERKAARAGVVFEPVVAETDEDALALHRRLLAVEARSWKGLSGEGLMIPAFAAFYREMLPRLARRGAVRAQVGKRDGEDVAIVVGGVIDTPGGVAYRGLQFSFDDRLRPLGLGNVAQLAQIEALSREGVALYDLGSDVDYKRRWGEGCLTTVTLVAVPRRLPAP